MCHTPLVKNCTVPGPEVCRTEYETWCMTRQRLHETEDDVPDCRTVTEPRCDETGENCVSLAREECSLERRTVVKTTPLTGCDKVQDGPLSLVGSLEILCSHWLGS